MKLTLMGSYPDDHEVRMVHEAGDAGEVRRAAAAEVGTAFVRVVATVFYVLELWSDTLPPVPLHSDGRDASAL